MLNRRSTLFNLVTLTITSNVSSTITCNGQTYSSVTSATFRIRQGTEVTWSVSADNYKAKSESVVMDGNKDVNVTLELDGVSFTITSNVSSTITINGDTSTGVKTKTLAVPRNSTVSWSVSASGYKSQSGSYDIGTSDYSMSVSLSLYYAKLKINFVMDGGGDIFDGSEYGYLGSVVYNITEPDGFNYNASVSLRYNGPSHISYGSLTSVHKPGYYNIGYKSTEVHGNNRIYSGWGGWKSFSVNVTESNISNEDTITVGTQPISFSVG